MQQLRLFFIAAQFFTRLPIPRWVGFEQEWLPHASRYFPLVGIVVGAIAVCVYAAAALVLPAPVAAVLSTAATIYATGAFHEDGFADTCDGLGGGMTRERVLEIMKDSRVGAYGAIGVVCMLGAKCSTLAMLPPASATAALLLAHPQPDIGPGICYGRTDISTSIEAIAPVAASLRVSGLPGLLPVYASPLARCALLAAALDVPVTLDARLAEMDFGAWEMRAWDAIPRAEVDAWAADLLRYRPGGGENIAEVAQRVAAFRQELPHPAVLIICHAGTIRLLSALHAGGDIEQAALRAASRPHHIGYGEVVMLKD